MEEKSHAGEEPLKMRSTEAGVTFPSSGCFDCNICLEFAVDPVVTLCGHLYCWPCIYKWLQQSVRTSSQHCPVCKASLSQDSLVPLYGRGNSSKKSHQNVDIPRRPSVHRESTESQSESEIMERYPANQPHNRPLQYSHQLEHPYINSGSDYTTLGTTAVLHSTAGGFLAGMALDLLPLMFRNHQFSGMYYSSPYYPTSNDGSLRLRRQELELKRSLHQIWVFFFCLVILCLLLF